MCGVGDEMPGWVMRKEIDGTRRSASRSDGETNALSGSVIWPPASAETWTNVWSGLADGRLPAEDMISRFGFKYS